MEMKGQQQYGHPSYNQEPAYSQQPVIVQQPTIVFQNAPQLGPDPQIMTCPSCRNSITTRIEYKSTTSTHLCAGLLCLTVLWPCVIIPYCTPCLRNKNHHCPNCNFYIGTYNN